ncbi:MAG: M20/M25/M40 family metallo-hydrolase [Tissierella sp.]|nr:M20/M25/M40 family metallo-hydrolase [Tissierella sp.]
MIYLLFTGIILLIFILILIFRAISFRPVEEENYEEFDIELNQDQIVNRFSEMIKCKTISYKDTSLEEGEEFVKFEALLVDRYPNVNSNCSLQYIGPSGILYHWKGKSSDKPVVFMAHYDVVPVNEEEWKKNPFSAHIEDDVIWGRGTLDTKGTLCGIMEAAEELIGQGFVPENDIYLSFSGDEETNGSSAKEIVDFFRENGIKPDMVLDEGGAIVQGVVPGVKDRCALIGTGEKGKIHLKLSTKSQGGHASSPPPISPIGRLSKAVTNIEKNPFNFHISKPVEDMFDTLGRHSSFGMKIIFANLRIFSLLLDTIAQGRGGELNALFRTTVAFTKMEASDAVNVFPPYASIEADIRVMEGDTEDSIIKALKNRVADDNISVDLIDVIPVKHFSDTKTEGWEKLKSSIKEVWGDVLVSPYLMIACSDSRHFTSICDNVYRFSAMELSDEERKLIHGNNERIPVDKLMDLVKFYINLMKKF